MIDWSKSVETKRALRADVKRLKKDLAHSEANNRKLRARLIRAEDDAAGLRSVLTREAIGPDQLVRRVNMEY